MKVKKWKEATLNKRLKSLKLECSTFFGGSFRYSVLMFRSYFANQKLRNYVTKVLNTLLSALFNSLNESLRIRTLSTEILEN